MNSRELQSYFSGIGEESGVPWDAFSDATVLVTGATGLVGFNVIGALLANAEKCDKAPTVVALVRNVDRARERFSAFSKDNLVFVQGDVTDPIDESIRPDYIVHAAARTDSAGMVGEPLSVIATTLDGTRNVMNLACATNPRKVLFVSSMEVYGANDNEEPLSEHDYGVVDPLSVRSSYPEAKKMAENLCVSYQVQCGVPVCIARLAQTFGPGIPANDQRVFAYFARCGLNGCDIELATPGTSTRMYVSALDAAAALLVLLAKGEPGEAYNVANEDTYCSILEMAELVRDEIAKGSIAVRAVQGHDGRFPPTHHLRLDVSRLRALGWQPRTSLLAMFESILDSVS